MHTREFISSPTLNIAIIPPLLLGANDIRASRRPAAMTPRLAAGEQ